MALSHSYEVKHTWQLDHLVPRASTYVASGLPFGAVDCPAKTAGHVEVGVVKTEKGGVEGVERRSGGQRLRNGNDVIKRNYARETTTWKILVIAVAVNSS